MEDMDKEDYRKPSGDEGEVVFSQQEEGAATTGSHGPRMDRQNENGWLEDTEPYIDVNQLVDNVLGGYGRTRLGLSRHPGPDVASGTTNPTGGRNPDATTTGTTQRWKSTTERTPVKDEWNSIGP